MIHTVSHKHDDRMLDGFLNAAQEAVEIILLVHSGFLRHIVTVDQADIIIPFIAGYIENAVPAVFSQKAQTGLVQKPLQFPFFFLCFGRHVFGAFLITVINFNIDIPDAAVRTHLCGHIFQVHLIVFAADNGDEVSRKICLFLKGFLFLFPEGQTAFGLHLVESGYELRLSYRL